MENVTIDKVYFDTLLKFTRQYVNLRRNLSRGGITEEMLAILIKDDSPDQENASVSLGHQPQINGAHPHRGTIESRAVRGGESLFGRDAVRNPQHGERRNRSRDVIRRSLSNINHDDGFIRKDVIGEHDEAGHNDDVHRSSLSKYAQRTLQLTGLSESTRHEDILKVVRGGQLLDIHLRPSDRIVHISFLKEADAQCFFRYVKRHDLYIKDRRVEIRWNDRQFILPGHIARQISKGATRNLIIQNCTSIHTEATIRDDLEHIHNLVIIKVAFKDQTAFISTNSVHNAMYARTCLMSRTSYRSTKIVWDSDECAASLEKPMQIRQKREALTKSTKAVLNRFELLNGNGSEDETIGDTLAP